MTPASSGLERELAARAAPTVRPARRGNFGLRQQVAPTTLKWF